MQNLTRKIMIAMMLGALVGIAINGWFKDIDTVDRFLTNGVFYVLGAIFIASLKMLVVPLVFVSLVGGVTSLGSLSALGRMSVKAIALYLMTTMIAVSIALSLAVSIGPGAGFDAGTQSVTYVGKEAPPFAEVLIDMVPSNPIQAMASGNMLQIILFALLFGIAITMAGERGMHVLNLFRDLDVVIMKMVEIIMRFAPYGVFALIARTFASQGLELILPLLSYFLTLSAALGIHAFIVYPVILKSLANLNPLVFLRKMRDPATFAFSTASSAATIPISLRTTEAKMGVDNAVASFTIPLGATINMDGTAIMQGVATVFIANVYHYNLGLTDYLLVVVTATLASIGTAAVPGVGLIMLTMVLNQVGLPVEGIALIIGVDRILDMMRTACNVTGDCAMTCVIAKSEGALDLATFNNPAASAIETR
ncbi:MAG: dicarboxylate/amino acid:cation symporter [Proteobacteria bacterium]|nr:dicarboxylate/amino acid:cation symporter [Pseudomonadota bacterium]